MGVSKKFDGKRYSLKARQHSKRAATNFAKKQRDAGKSARVTKDVAGGHANWNVWVK